jgi:thioredoxin-related protein
MKTSIKFLQLLLGGFVFYVLACSQTGGDYREVDRTGNHVAGGDQVQEYILPQLLKKAEKEGKIIFLVFSMKGCSPCRRMNLYHNDSTVKPILSKYMLIQEFDALRSAEGKELYKKYWKPGFPAWTILDPEGRTLSDSGIPGKGLSNIGFPEKAEDIDHYLTAIRTAAPVILQQECEILAVALGKYGKKSYITP